MDSLSYKLLDWYDLHARELPWRIPPKRTKQGINPDPYHIWLSEVMLQQTTVVTVAPYFHKFLKTWPSVNNLAAASDDDVLAAWAGLGYYSRARNLLKAARIVANEFGGNFPDTEAGLKALPGIGDYTAAAIAAIAFDRPSAVVDGNIERIVTRLTTDSTPLPQVKSACRDFMTKCVPNHRPGDFSQAMMDLGATICSPRKPRCGDCPINTHCLAFASGTAEKYPVKPPKKTKQTRKGAVFVLSRHNGAIWLIKRPPTGLLGGMTAFPSTDWTSTRDGSTTVDEAPLAGAWEDCGTIHHTFTHFHLELRVWSLTVERDQVPSGGGRWTTAQNFDESDLPTLMRKALKATNGASQKALPL